METVTAEAPSPAIFCAMAREAVPDGWAGARSSALISQWWLVTCCTILCAKTSGFSSASATVSGSSGQPGAIVAYPAASKTSRQGCQLVDSSQRP